VEYSVNWIGESCVHGCVHECVCVHVHGCVRMYVVCTWYYYRNIHNNTTIMIWKAFSFNWPTIKFLLATHSIQYLVSWEALRLFPGMQQCTQGLAELSEFLELQDKALIKCLLRYTMVCGRVVASMPSQPIRMLLGCYWQPSGLQQWNRNQRDLWPEKNSHHAYVTHLSTCRGHITILPHPLCCHTLYVATPFMLPRPLCCCFHKTCEHLLVIDTVSQSEYHCLLSTNVYWAPLSDERDVGLGDWRGVVGRLDISSQDTTWSVGSCLYGIIVVC